MTLEQFLEQTKDFPRDAIIMAYDGEEEKVIPVTGLLFTGSITEKPFTIELCTDDNS